MVADGTGIIVHQVHQSGFHVSFEQGIIRRALREVTTVEEQQLGIRLTLFFQHSNATQEATTTSQSRVGKVLTQRQNAAVRVIGMQDRQFLLPTSGINA